MQVMNNVLQGTFGLKSFRPGQEQVIQRLLDGESALAIFPTGAGKSLCYQLPAVMLDGLTLVVSPLIALMKDQLDALRRKGVPAARLDSSLSAAASREVYAALRENKLKMLYVAPERLGNERFLETLSKVPLSLMAVDEAHCISEWGHNFRPDYMKLADLARDLNIPRVLALTATATPDVATSVAKAFNIPVEGVIRSSAYRPNLHMLMQPGPAEERFEKLVPLLGKGPAIVYVTTQRSAEDLARRLSEAGVKALPYHAGLESERRSIVQDQFMESDSLAVVATIAFGMGVDKANIRTVVHYNLPKSPENYAQEIGRAGRDGEVSQCVLLASPDDRITLENFTYGDTPTEEALRGLLEELMHGGEEFDISVYDLAAKHDIRQLVTETVLTYLELDGILKATVPFYAEYRWTWLKARESTLGRMDADRAALLRKVFTCAQEARKWTRLDVTSCSRKINEPRPKIISALNHLEELGAVELTTAGVRQGYKRLKTDLNVEELVQELQARFALREVRDLKRLNDMEALIHDQGCTTRGLLHYFGEELEKPCGTCGVCTGHPPAAAPDARPPVDEEAIAIIKRVDHRRLRSLAHPRQLTRFLCGLSSPASTKDRLSRDTDFGLLSALPFPAVLAAVEEFSQPRQWESTPV